MEKRTILVVDDNRSEIEIMKEAIGDVCGGLNVVEACSGEDCIALLSGDDQSRNPFRPDLILLDLNMPGTGGREVLAKIKGDPRLSHIPVVVFTSSSLEKDVLDSHRLYANSFVTKPSDYKSLLTLMKSLFTYWFHVATIPLATR